MSTLIELFQPICLEVQSQIQDALKGIAGFLIQEYLPQIWHFKTERESVSFCINKNGVAAVIPGLVPNPDVSITVDHNYLSEALKMRKQPAYAYNTLSVVTNTPKGRTAYQFICKKLGIK